MRWGIQGPDLVRFNRVEGLSLGVRGLIRPHTSLGFLTVGGEARLGSGDREPNVRVAVSRETLVSRVTLSAYHELAPVDETKGHLRLGNSLTSLLVGRDEGDYFRRTGAQLEWRPPSSRHPVFRLTGFAEYHTLARRSTDFSVRHLVDGGSVFRDNIAAEEGLEVGAQLLASPRWGTDPRRVQGGLSAGVRAVTGDFEYVRTFIGGDVVVPLGHDFDVGLEVEGGTSWGTLPSQRSWLLGGAGSLAAYAPGSRQGSSRFRGRAGVGRRFAFGALSLFSDLGWAGERQFFDADDGLLSVGLGLSLADGLIRVDFARGLRAPESFRIDAYLDAIP